MLHDEHIYDCQRHPLIPCDSTWMSEAQRQYAESWKVLARKLIGQMLKEEQKKEEQKEAPIMGILKVEYNGFTGELVKLERLKNVFNMSPDGITAYLYNLSIYDSEKEATCSFEKVKLEDIKFLGGAVSFG